jgi:hypothetical protein
MAVAISNINIKYIPIVTFVIIRLLYGVTRKQLKIPTTNIKKNKTVLFTLDNIEITSSSVIPPNLLLYKNIMHHIAIQIKFNKVGMLVFKFFSNTLRSKYSTVITSIISLSLIFIFSFIKQTSQKWYIYNFHVINISLLGGFYNTKRISLLNL